MIPASEGTARFRGWSEDDADRLRAIWDELVPFEKEGRPTFQGEALEPQAAGWVFERWLTESFRSGGACGYHRYNNPMHASGRIQEEIDGLLFDGWQGFLVEAKYEQNPVGIDPIFRLHLMAEQRPIGTLGLLFSVSGFTEPAIELAERLRPIRVLLFDKADLNWALNSGWRMMELVRRKWVLALRHARPHLPVSRHAVPFGES